MSHILEASDVRLKIGGIALQPLNTHGLQEKSRNVSTDNFVDMHCETQA
jgi:hypothetical protein